MNENNSNSVKSKNNSSKNKNKAKPFFVKKKKPQAKKTLESKVSDAKGAVNDLKLYEKLETEPKKKQDKKQGNQPQKKAQTKKNAATAAVPQKKQNAQSKKQAEKPQKKAKPIKVAFLGGLGEVGKNITLF